MRGRGRERKGESIKLVRSMDGKGKGRKTGKAFPSQRKREREKKVSE